MTDCNTNFFGNCFRLLTLFIKLTYIENLKISKFYLNQNTSLQPFNFDIL